MEKKNLMNSAQIHINNDFTKFSEVFLKQNSILNLISKNEEKYLYEKHIYDSLAIKLFFEKYNLKPETLLDIGTGGGFPAVPIAIEYPQIRVTALDSIRKKITAIDNIKSELNISNLYPVCSRVENLNGCSFDIITSRAVAALDKLAEYAAPLLRKGGYFVAYKSKRAMAEIEEAQKVLKTKNLQYIESIDYTLPLDEVYERKLLIFKAI